MFSMCSLATYWLNLRPDPSPNNKSLRFSIFAGKYRKKQNEKRVGKQSKRFGKICLGNFQVMSFSLLAAISVLHVAVCVFVGHLWLHAHTHTHETDKTLSHTHTRNRPHTHHFNSAKSLDSAVLHKRHSSCLLPSPPPSPLLLLPAHFPLSNGRPNWIRVSN